MATSLDQQEQLNRIMADAVAPVKSFSAGQVNAAQLGAEMRFRKQLADEANARALEQTLILERSRNATELERTERYFKGLSERERQAEFKKLRDAGITRPEKMTDDEYLAYGSKRLGEILGIHDANIEGLQNDLTGLAGTVDQGRAVFARDAGLRALQATMDPKNFAVVSQMVRSGKPIDEVVGSLRLPGKIWGTNPIKPAEAQQFSLAFQNAAAAALENPPSSAMLQARAGLIQGELQKALALRNKFSEEFPGAALNQASSVKPSPLLDLPRIQALDAGAKAGFMGPVAPAGAVIPQTAPMAAPVLPPPPGATRVPGLIPSAVGMVEPLIPSRQEMGAVLEPIRRAAGNVGAAIFGGDMLPIRGSMTDANREAIRARMKNYTDLFTPASEALLSPYFSGQAYGNMGRIPQFSQPQPRRQYTQEEIGALMQAIAPMQGAY